MMMTLGLFVFQIGTLPYQELVRATEWRWPGADRFGARPALQYAGPGADDITLTGALFPGLVGRYSALDTIRAMAEAGEAYCLIDGLGNIIGWYVIAKLEDKRTTFFVDGVARKADFTLSLLRAPDPEPAQTSEAAS